MLEDRYHRKVAEKSLDLIEPPRRHCRRGHRDGDYQVSLYLSNPLLKFVTEDMAKAPVPGKLVAVHILFHGIIIGIESLVAEVPAILLLPFLTFTTQVRILLGTAATGAGMFRINRREGSSAPVTKGGLFQRLQRYQIAKSQPDRYPGIAEQAIHLLIARPLRFIKSTWRTAARTRRHCPAIQKQTVPVGRLNDRPARPAI